MPPSINNTDGFWENLRFVRLNERLLAASGGTWFAPPQTLLVTPQIRVDADALVSEFKGAEPWAWKDPRNALTLSFWRSVLPTAKVLLCVRHPSETASSLMASTLVPRTFFWTATNARSSTRPADVSNRAVPRLVGMLRTFVSPSERRRRIGEVCTELWRVSNERVLRETTPRDRIVTRYEDVLANPRAALQRILDRAEITVPAEILDQATQAVSLRMRHQRAGSHALHPKLAGLYDRLAREARDAS